MHAGKFCTIFLNIIKTNRINCLRKSSLLNQRWITSTASVQSTAAEPALKLPHEREFDPKLVKIVDEISKLTLIEVSDLNKLLKITLNIPDAPMMQMAAMPASSSAASAQAEEEEPVAVKSEYAVKLMKYDDTKKVPLIKEVKQLVEGMNLVQAKKFVESVPQVIQTGLSKDDAEKLKKRLEELGGEVTLE